jgi:preprotein translocase subunit SecF
MRLKLIPSDTRINFFRYLPTIFLTSSCAVLISILAFFLIGLNYGIDFRGGTMLMIDTPQKLPISDFREILSKLDVGDTSVTEISDPTQKLSGGVLISKKNLVMIRIEQEENKDAIQSEKILRVKKKLSQNFVGIKFLQTESVGSKVSKELIFTGIKAVILAVCAVLFYVWIRFEWQFAVGAVCALVHDVAITIGIFSILGLEFNLSIIAALLTIVGYSLNDTVIIYDRVRENLRKIRSRPLVDVVNLAINETLSRTFMTSVTTLLALFSLYILGGDVIRGFTFAMIWGVLVGTFSSIFVASALLLKLGVKRDWSKNNNNAGTQFTDNIK